ncbi:MAG: 16S rRNA (cytidine(1402)-2'-O)-methyltransferase [Pseudomonadota bacterium]
MTQVWDRVALPSGLYFVATPLGNARDITLRALDILASADVLAAEDTRRLKQLMDMHRVPLNGRRIVAYHDHNGPKTRPGLLSALKEGKSVAYVSDAGSPLIADPGFVLGREAIALGADVFASPGPAAVIAALTVSGLPSDRFTFAGFPPSAAVARTKFFEGFSGSHGTLIFYESPKRVSASLQTASTVFGHEHPAVLARELTKKFEEVRRGTLAELIESCGETAPRGEIVLLIAPARQSVSKEDIDVALIAAMKTTRLKDAARDVAERYGVSRRDLYQRGLELRDPPED